MSAFPESMKHADFLTAIRPLLALCGTTPEAAHADLRIVQHDGNDSLYVEFLSVVDPNDGTRPVVVGGSEFGEYSWPVTVAVI